VTAHHVAAYGRIVIIHCVTNAGQIGMRRTDWMIERQKLLDEVSKMIDARLLEQKNQFQTGVTTELYNPVKPKRKPGRPRKPDAV